MIPESSWEELPGRSSTTSAAVPISGPIVYLAGVNWDAIAGTDRRLVAALARRGDVVWVDPPMSILRRSETRRLEGSTSPEMITRIRTYGPPALTRPVVRKISRWLVAGQIRRALRRLGVAPGLVVLAGSNLRFPAKLAGLRVLYVTDDWVDGSGLMGVSRADTAKVLSRNARDANLVLAVSPNLASVVAARTGVGKIEVLANGAEPVARLSAPAPAGSPAILIGQLNERLDIGVLERLAHAGIPLTVVGPRAERDPEFGQRLDAVLSAPSVDWLGSRPYDDLVELMASASVGITPYADSPFNRSSYPLKTLEYLGAGLPVVSTNIPAAELLGADDVDIVGTSEDFLDQVRKRIAQGRTRDGDRSRHAFATANSWDARAELLWTLVARSQAGTSGRSSD
jgi:teichuronic acid biosynthesis glycosyltransferase TuaH